MALGSNPEVLDVTAGNLSTQLGSDMGIISNLSLYGNINGADICCLRSMEHLNVLNLTNVKIVAGESFTFDDSVIMVSNSKIPANMFNGIYTLTKISLPTNVSTIGNYAFYNCIGLTSITIPESVGYIGEFAFHNCIGMTSFDLGLGVISLGRAVFCGSLKLKKITVPDANSAFCSDDGVLFSKDKKQLLRYPNDKSPTYIIPASCTSIMSHAFCGCSGLNSVTIPNDVTSIGEDAFYDCTSLKELHCKALIPPTLSSGTFMNVNKDSCTLYVPKGTYQIYKSSAEWGDFKRIVEDNAMAITKINKTVDGFYTENNAIVLTGTSIGDVVSIYTPMGILVKTIKATGKEIRIEVPANHLYLLKMADRTFKVSL